MTKIKKAKDDFLKTIKEVKNPWQFVLVFWHMIIKYKRLKEILLIINALLLIYIIIGPEKLSKIPVVGKIFKQEKRNENKNQNL